jgi:folate-binding protein YgfZ
MNGSHLESVELDDLGVLRIVGADAARFLQGQLSNDLGRVSAERSALGGLHNPQGRTIALLRIVQLAPNDLLAVLPRELAAPVAGRLSKYVLRARVKVSDESQSWRVRGLIACGLVGTAESRAHEPADPSAPPGSAPLGAYPLAPGEQRRLGESMVVCVDEQPVRWLLIAPAADAAASAPATSQAGGGLPHAVPVRREVWRQLDIISGLPQVYAATSEEFVAQMLNLDVVGAIAFDKGCYTGQEVIARAHYRGRVKRRLQRFRSRGPLDLKPGDSGELADGRAFKVVEAVRLEDGHCEFLAVAPLASAETELSAGSRPDAMLERISAPLGVRPSQAGAAALTRSNVGAPATGAALHSSMPAELTTTGAFWAPFATSPGSPRKASASTLPPSPPDPLPHDLEQLELPYELPA